MIEYIIKDNIDDRILKRVSNLLFNGGIIAYPTDSSWCIGCSVTSIAGIEKLRKIKGDFQNYTLTMICSNISQIEDVAEFNNKGFKVIKKYTPGPFVFVLPAKKKIEKKVNMKRLEIGVRIPNNPVPIKIIETHGHPIFSITASRIIKSKGWWDYNYAEENLYEYGWELEEIEGIDIILDHGDSLPKLLTTVIRLNYDNIEIIREGAGSLKF